MYNRKQRRELEKSAGLQKIYQNMSEADKAELRKRRAASGKQIHLQNVQAREQYEIEQETLRYTRMIERYQSDGMTDEEATAAADAQLKIEQDRWEKKHAKKITSQETQE
jgi:hypothetical protein